MRQTPGRLASLVKGLSEKQLRAAPVRGKWNIAQLVCHLADTELVLGFRLRVAIAESGRSLQAIAEKKWAARLGYNKGSIRTRLELFRHLRRENVRLLGSLSPAAWNRYGMHTERGKETVERMAQMYAGHDLNHLEQISGAREALKGKRR